MAPSDNMTRLDRLRKLHAELVQEKGYFYAWAAHIIKREIERKTNRIRRPTKPAKPKQLELLG